MANKTHKRTAISPRWKPTNRQNEWSGGNHGSSGREGYSTRHRIRRSRHDTSDHRQWQLTQGDWHQGQKAPERRGRGLTLTLALLLSLKQKFMHTITHPSAAINTYPDTQHTVNDDCSPYRAKNYYTLCPLQQGTNVETTPQRKNTINTVTKKTRKAVGKKKRKKHKREVQTKEQTS